MDKISNQPPEQASLDGGILCLILQVGFQTKTQQIQPLAPRDRSEYAVSCMGKWTVISLLRGKTRIRDRAYRWPYAGCASPDSAFLRQFGCGVLFPWTESGHGLDENVSDHYRSAVNAVHASPLMPIKHARGIQSHVDASTSSTSGT